MENYVVEDDLESTVIIKNKFMNDNLHSNSSYALDDDTSMNQNLRVRRRISRNDFICY